jgi:CNT family concentrative nucleoside transporter
MATAIVNFLLNFSMTSNKFSLFFDPILHGFFGVSVFLFVAYLLSENRSHIKLRPILVGLSIEVFLTLMIFKIPAMLEIFNWIDHMVLALNAAALEGTQFVFGYLGGGTPLPFKTSGMGSSFILAFQALPLVIVVASLSSLLFYLRVLPLIIQGMSWVFRKTLGVGGALAVGLSANLFLGMAESPVVIRPYLQHLTRSELFTLMTCGMAGVAGTVMALYVILLGPVISGVMTHILSAVLISIPGTVMISRMIIPETDQMTRGKIIYQREALGIVDAIMSGVKIGGEIFVSIIGMLIVFIALIALLNKAISFLPMVHGQVLSLSFLLGYIFMPFMWVMGIPWSEAHTAGDLMGTRMILNEIVSYQQLANLPAGALSSKSALMMVYAMCGFANIGSLGIMLAAYNVLIPERRHEFVSLAPRSLIAGTLVTCITATVVGALYGFKF